MIHIPVDHLKWHILISALIAPLGFATLYARLRLGSGRDRISGSRRLRFVSAALALATHCYMAAPSVSPKLYVSSRLSPLVYDLVWIVG